MKKCPYCSENIQDKAIKCKFCGEFLNDVMTNEEKIIKNEKNSNILGGIVAISIYVLFIGILLYILSDIFFINFLKDIFTEKGILGIINRKHGTFFYVIVCIGIIFSIIYKLGGLFNTLDSKDGNGRYLTVIYTLLAVLPILVTIAVFVGLGINFSFTLILNYIGFVEIGFLLILFLSEYIPLLGIVGIFLPIVYYIYIIIKFII
ncbi:MAG: zinc ribbon domain-containing protein [Candidatus Gracilibacteria bacterium]|nr:zinc ribbon domain-containing protein [Candidatus Gracilibacteria bacterium]MDD3120168.1 zinc ribbon domain-containing protein [Candidatus Gracilibacteria bacterium]MDD4530254.1 zinc ribbon domain-containing protein [Candidatus Gracilibacteria bacterium]